MAVAKTINTRIVLRNDELAAWEKSEKQLLKGEVAFARLSGTNDFEMRIGTGDKTWNQLSDSNVIVPDSTKFYEKATFAELEAVTGKNGDIGVVKEEIAAGKYSYTAYRFNKATNGWVALDGNYNASNVIFDEDLTYTTGIGVIAAPSGGSGTLTTAGKSVEDLFKQILAKESTSITIDKTWTVTFSVANDQNQTGEVGSVISKTPRFELKSTDAPNWDSFGGINESGTKVTAATTGSVLSGEILSGSTVLASKTDVTTATTLTSYTLPTTTWTSSTFTDAGESRTVTATSYATGSTSKPVTNLGNLILTASTEANDKITGISKTGSYSVENYAAAKGGFSATAVTPSNSSQTVTAKGYRKGFFGYRLVSDGDLDFDNLTSDDIRKNIHAKTFNFNAGDKSKSSNWLTSFTVPKDSKQIIFAVPKEVIGTDHQYIKMSNIALGTYYFENNGLLRTTTNKLSVDGASADTGTEYAIWTINPDAGFAADTVYTIEYGSTKKQ